MKCYAGRHTVKAVGVVDEEETETCWHVTEYEERGSLRKVLADESRKLHLDAKCGFCFGCMSVRNVITQQRLSQGVGENWNNKFLLGLNWEIKMCDFALTGNPDRARVYLKTQNRSYMPLEHFTESPMTYNMTTECHGVGVILIEIATRKSATEAKTLPDDCPDEYRKVVNGLMKPDPCIRMNIRDAAMALTALRTRLCAVVDSNGSCS
ncbi:uncharacterized protein [Ptychodera flava]|uniref:uncharacterized protein n=1 Tax=Ptychodera flava TaxID=63121 RepID=UPI00396A5015